MSYFYFRYLQAYVTLFYEEKGDDYEEKKELFQTDLDSLFKPKNKQSMEFRVNFEIKPFYKMAMWIFLDIITRKWLTFWRGRYIIKEYT